MKGLWPRRGNRRPWKERGFVRREAGGGGGEASGPTAGPSFPGVACEARVRLIPMAVPGRRLHVAASGLCAAEGAGHSGREATLGCEREKRETGGGDDRATGRGREAGAPRRPPARPVAGPAAPPSASSSRAGPGRAAPRYLEG